MNLYSFTIEFFASFAIWLMFAGILVLWIIDGKIKKEQVLHALLAFIIAWIISETIKRLIPIPRPFLSNGHKVLTLTEFSLTSGSFPSSHSAAAFSLATTIWLHDKKVGWFYLILATLVGAARVLANVHFPIDVLGGAFVGMMTSFAVEKAHLYKLITKLRRKKIHRDIDN